MKDECREIITKLVIEAGKIIRQLKGLPEEKNITELYKETAPLLGVEPRTGTSRDARTQDGINKVKDKKRAPLMPLQKCPSCSKETMELKPLCRTCTDAEGGKYKTKWECSECGHKEKSEKFYIQWLKEKGVEWRGGMKKEIGIKTATDEVLK